MPSAFIGLGSNLGDRLANLHRAIGALASRPDIAVLRSSRVYETEPIGPPQPRYLNAVVEVMTSVPAREVLAACLQVEREMGRERGERWGPRVIDLDLLTYGDERIDEPGLTVPHPRMHERGFVLIPLLELEADPPLPDGRKVADLRLGPETLTGVRLFAPGLPIQP